MTGKIDRRHMLAMLGSLGAWPALGAPPAVPASAPLPHPQITPGAILRFPRDFGAHPDFRTEWWYITGRLSTTAGAAFGFQVTFFRSRIDAAQDNPSQFAAKQLIMAHAAVTDLAGGRLLHAQRIARAGLGLAGAELDDTHVHLKDWSLQRTGDAGRSQYAAQVSAGEFAFDLALRATQPLLLQGEAGYSRKGPLPSQASRYYSQPQLGVQGQLALRGRVQTVTGQAWMDHEWSEAAMPPDAVGWDWIGMNLQDGSALMAARMRRADGSALWAGGSFRQPGQAARVFGPGEVQFKPVRVWRSPATHAPYPVEWRVSTPVGTFTVRARLDAQELAGQAGTGTVYWEGLSSLLDDAGQHTLGEGYLEMTGYAKPIAFF